MQWCNNSKAKTLKRYRPLPFKRTPWNDQWLSSVFLALEKHKVKILKHNPTFLQFFFNTKMAGFAFNNGKRRISLFPRVNLKIDEAGLLLKRIDSSLRNTCRCIQWCLKKKVLNAPDIVGRGRGGMKNVPLPAGWPSYGKTQETELRHMWYEAFATWLMLKSRERLGTGVGFYRSGIFSTWFQWRNSEYGY